MDIPTTADSKTIDKLTVGFLRNRGWNTSIFQLEMTNEILLRGKNERGEWEGQKVPAGDVVAHKLGIDYRRADADTRRRQDVEQIIYDYGPTGDKQIQEYKSSLVMNLAVEDCFDIDDALVQLKAMHAGPRMMNLVADGYMDVYFLYNDSLEHNDLSPDGELVNRKHTQYIDWKDIQQTLELNALCDTKQHWYGPKEGGRQQKFGVLLGPSIFSKDMWAGFGRIPSGKAEARKNIPLRDRRPGAHQRGYIIATRMEYIEQGRDSMISYYLNEHRAFRRAFPSPVPRQIQIEQRRAEARAQAAEAAANAETDEGTSEDSEPSEDASADASSETAPN